MKPMKAATLDDFKMVKFPIYLSPKLDGFRCLTWEGQPVSKNLKPIPNKFIRNVLSKVPNGLDGELIVGSPTDVKVFNKTSSGVTTIEGTPNFKLYLFDNFNSPAETFAARFMSLEGLIPHDYLEIVPHTLVHTVEQLMTLESKYVKMGYEGVMLRAPHGHYKMGRSTCNEGLLWKLKRFTDGEAKIIGITAGVRNENPATRNAAGEIERSTHKKNMIETEMVGTILAIDMVTNKHINISPGRMTHDERAHYFKNPHKIIGKYAKYKAFDYGTVNVPRFCTFQGFRDPIDL